MGLHLHLRAALVSSRPGIFLVSTPTFLHAAMVLQGERCTLLQTMCILEVTESMYTHVGKLRLREPGLAFGPVLDVSKQL